MNIEFLHSEVLLPTLAPHEVNSSEGAATYIRHICSKLVTVIRKRLTQTSDISKLQIFAMHQFCGIQAARCGSTRRQLQEKHGRMRSESDSVRRQVHWRTLEESCKREEWRRRVRRSASTCSDAAEEPSDLRNLTLCYFAHCLRAVQR